MPGPNTPYTKLDYEQVITQSFDESKDRLRVDAQVSASISDIVIEDPDGDILQINPDGSINTQVEGTIDVAITDTTDSIKIGDGSGVYLDINPDGSINVNTITIPSDETVMSFFNSVSSVPSATETLIVTYTVPVLITSRIIKVSFSGENIATYNLYLNGSLIDRYRTYFSGGLSGDMDFSVNNLEGYEIQTGDVIDLKVIHSRPDPATFDGKLLLVEKA